MISLCGTPGGFWPIVVCVVVVVVVVAYLDVLVRRFVTAGVQVNTVVGLLNVIITM